MRLSRLSHAICRVTPRHAITFSTLLFLLADLWAKEDCQRKGKKGLDLEGTTVRDDSRERKEHFKDRVRRALVYRQEYGMKLQESRYCGLTGFNLEENIDLSEERYKTQQWRNCKHYSIVWNNEERCEWVILSRVESWWGRCNPRRDPSGLPNLCWSG